MTSTSFRVLVLWLVVATARVLAQGPPDFSGQWKLDEPDSSSTGGGRGAGTGGGGGQGGGLGLGPSAENLTITQTATSLTIEERWASGGLARRVYPLDGRQANNTLGAGRGPTATSSRTLHEPQAGHDAGRDVQRLYLASCRRRALSTTRAGSLWRRWPRDGRTHGGLCTAK